MPLNPPSYKGQDVWFSPDVFVNKSEVALWQPAWPRENVPLPAFGPITIGDDLAASGTVPSELQARAYLNTLVKQGAMTQDQADQVLNARPTANDPTNNAIPSTTSQPITNETGEIENLKEFPLNLQLSRYFTLGQLTRRPWVIYEYSIPPQGINGLTAGQIVSNLKLLAVNVLDKIKDRFPNMAVTNTFRANKGEGQHGLGQAADIQFTGQPKSSFYDNAVWIRDNTPFDQLLLEYSISSNGPSSWIHVSYKPTPRPFGIECKVGTLLAPSNWINRRGLTNYSTNIGLA